ncbi:MAG: hypothetical protein AB1Z98_32015 [Nannocystaceae bacterium]
MAQIAGASDPEPPRKDRIEQLWLDAAGTSGRVETSPTLLGNAPATVHFGVDACGRAHRVGPATLSLLQQALASGQPVRIDTAPSTVGGEPRHCLTGVAVFAPLP